MMRFQRRSSAALLIAALLLAGVGASRSGAAETPPGEPPPAHAPMADPLAGLSELGITYALSGEVAAAESVFVSLLSQSPGDARALNNLGNLCLWRNDVDLALAFYARAEQADSTDAGIALNEATALMIGGEEEAARERAAEGIARAGGPEEAARLLGLRYAGTDDDTRAGDRAQVSRDEVLALLRAAMRAVPVDSTSAAHGTQVGSGAKRSKPVPAWRSAGARGAADTDAAAVVYWKR